MKKIIKNNLLGFILGAIIFGSIGVVATNYLLRASDVEYKNNKNLQDALDELYGMANSPRGAAMFKLQANGEPTSTSNTISVNFTKVEPITPTIVCRAKDASGNIVGTGTISNNTCNITGLQPETSYTYEIIRTDQNGVTDVLTGTKSTIKVGPTMQTSNLVSSTGTSYQGLLGIAYLDPTDLTKVCNVSNSVSTTGTKTGCMKWYAYKLENGNYTMILDHNTTAKVPYNTASNNNYYGTTSGYIGYDLTQLTSTHKWNSSLNPRLITADEVKTATQSGSMQHYFFNGNGSTNQAVGSNVYAWLFDYTSGCTSRGCNVADSSTSGYWTSNKHNISTGERRILAVRLDGYMTSNDPNYTDYGLRPVITVPNSILNIS